MHVRVCRDCGEEYRPGVLRCADCGGELEDRFGDEAPAASRPSEEEAAAAELAGQRVLFLTPRAADLVPLAERLREAGVEVSRLTMHFEEVHAKYENDAGILYSPPNRLAFPAVFTWTGQRFWGFWGKNPRGKNAAFRMDLDVRLGEVRPDGTAAADSVEIVRFELTKPYFKGE